jgi:hypothetical protein
MIYKTFASTLAITVALTATSFAQDKSATQPTEPKVEDVDAKASQDMHLKLGAIKGESQDKAIAGGGGGKVNVQDISIAAVPQAKDPKIGPIKGESQDRAMSVGSDGEDRLTENLTLRGGGGGKVDVQDLSLTKAPKLGDIKGEAQDKANIKFDGVEGESIDKAMAADVNEQVTLSFGANEAPACVTESGAVDADCNGVADEAKLEDKRDEVRRPEPRQQRR